MSTYRLQLHAGFGFRDARALVPYLAALGVTECYSSPHFKANPGSRHGYDISDHRALNPELGSEAEYAAFCAALAAHGLGHVVDIVPNHMAADAGSNPWWRDVLENGPSSPFADYFDIDWAPVKPELRGKVLLPVLGDQYGHVLERGELQLTFVDGALHLRYFERDFPINPRQSPRVLGRDVDRLEQALEGGPAAREYLSILTALQNLPPYTERDPARIVERHREKEVARERLARLVAESPAVAAHIDAVVREANGTPGDRASFDALHELLEHQAYRLAYWRTASDEINYRRFFDVNELVGLRMEQPDVFEASHALLKRLIHEGCITGLRVDHPDGLFDPEAYFSRLQELAGGPFYVAAEKILSPGERLAADWQVAGTTGYGFLNLVGGLFVDGRHLHGLRRLYARLTGQTASFEEIAYRSRLTVMLTAMASELNVLAHALNRLSEQDPVSRDFTLASCRRILREVAACFPVYRTYLRAGESHAVDQDVVVAALADARRRNPLMETSIFAFARAMLLPEVGTAETPPEGDAAERLRFAMKVQQFTAPVHAKGVEDTAFYRYHVLVSANEVGGRPGRPAVSPEDFHTANQQRLLDWPLELLTTTTHDTKRGEDARARIAAISERPDEWRRAVADWMRINARNRTRVEGAWAPDRNDEYLFYQSLIGVWPAEPAGAALPLAADRMLVDRLVGYMQKAVREAKVHTSWLREQVEYGRAVGVFVERTLTSATAPRFLASFAPFQRQVAHAGAVNSLAQLVLKLTAPGVPDFYQGSEFWDLSLVDPDNRRPVDYATRTAALAALAPLVAGIDAGTAGAADLDPVLDGWWDGRIKLLVTRCGLHLRRAHQDLLLSGSYEPLAFEGPRAAHLVGFARRHGAATLIVVVPRLTATLPHDARGWPCGTPTWAETQVVLPPGLADTAFRQVLTGRPLRAAPPDRGTAGPTAPCLPIAEVLETLPVSLLLAEPGA